MSYDYLSALQTAIAAAREAGALLREEFLRPGGPRGGGGHAETDQPAEELIRSRLLADTPDWAYLGEETGEGGKQGAEHLWVVDPNDGTAAYLKGFRGSAVSIALLREGVPVLGVVYAFVAPNNAGELFSWAEGCGPVRRDGVPITRVAWHSRLTAETVVLVSQAADRAPRANLACVAPGRYRAEPSIAYRLALVAAGDGEVAVSLNGPGGWDYAAGHALLRGTGGELVDETGAPVTYTRDGDSSMRYCFGGSPALAQALRRKLWDDIFATPPQPALPFDLSWPRRGLAVADDGLFSRAQGCLLGQLAGDALGSIVEFAGADAIRREYPGGLRKMAPSPVHHTLAGQPTDDSELALMLARTLLLSGSAGYVAEDVAAAYVYWYESPPFDLGGTTAAALGPMAGAKCAGTSLVEAAQRTARQESEANGALMRQSPLAIWGHALDAATLDAVVREDTRLTHPNRACQDASAAYIVALAGVIREGLDAEQAYELALVWDREHGDSPTVTKALRDARNRPPPFEPNIGHVIIALQNAFYQALHATTLEEGVVATVMGGGDTDTNAAIAGALLGALHGGRAIPAQWRQAVLTCRPLSGIAEIQCPRPRPFWPVDALRLAEQLVHAM